MWAKGGWVDIHILYTIRTSRGAANGRKAVNGLSTGVL
jgi:hypothetical protein